VAGEFLWMAAWLLQLKSKLLLPATRAEEPDPRDELVERLIAYRRVKELAALLHDIDLVRQCVWPAGFPTELVGQETELDLEEIDLRRLAETYLDVMQRFAAAHPPPIEVLPLRYNVPDTMRELYNDILSSDLVPLLRRLHQRPDPEEVVVLFVSALELIRLRAARAEQRAPFTEIYLRRGECELDDTVFTGREAADGDEA
jgi:segregation and condensation protein A